MIDPVILTSFMQELTDHGTLTFRTRPDDKKQHGVERALAVSWPPPRWMVDAAELCDAKARVSWNTVEANTREPVTLTVTGQREVSVAYYDDHAKEIWNTASIRLLDHWRVQPID